jgi:hemin uptake protein HemP
MSTENHQNTQSALNKVEDATQARTIKRIQSLDLFERAKEVEIEHDGRVYRLRVTQSNKLILTA